MGAQTDAPIVQLLQECEDADKGLLFESRDQFGLGYRTRVSLQNQAAAATLDYAAAQLGETVPQPVDDELLVVNDITLTRPTGSSFEATLMSGPLSVLDPPNGVGYYSQGFTYNLFADSQLANAATWALAVGTVDEFRWPVITADLRTFRTRRRHVRVGARPVHRRVPAGRQPARLRPRHRGETARVRVHRDAERVPVDVRFQLRPRMPLRRREPADMVTIRVQGGARCIGKRRGR